LNPGASSRRAEATAPALFDYTAVVLKAGHLKTNSSLYSRHGMLLCTVGDRQLPWSQEFQKDPTTLQYFPRCSNFGS